MQYISLHHITSLSPLYSQYLLIIYIYIYILYIYSKPSISMGHLYHGELLVITRGYIYIYPHHYPHDLLIYRAMIVVSVTNIHPLGGHLGLSSCGVGSGGKRISWRPWGKGRLKPRGNISMWKTYGETLFLKKTIDISYIYIYIIIKKKRHVIVDEFHIQLLVGA